MLKHQELINKVIYDFQINITQKKYCTGRNQERGKIKVEALLNYQCNTWEAHVKPQAAPKGHNGENYQKHLEPKDVEIGLEGG